MTKNDALMTRARRVDPKPTNPFKGFADSPEAEELLTAILEAPPIADDKRSSVQVRPPRQRGPLGAIARRTVAVGLAAAIVFGISTIASPDHPTPQRQTVWGAELVSFAERSPRLLLGRQGWSVLSAEEFSDDTGEMTFATSADAELAGAAPGEYWMSLNWYPSDMYDLYVDDRRRGADKTWKFTIDGHEAVAFTHNRTAPTGVTFYAIWTDGHHSLELRSDVIPTSGRFEEVARTAESVDVNSWLSAMPASVVKPQERGDEVDRILADIPVPSNVDVGSLKNRTIVSNGLTYEVTTTVLCGWIQQWIDATRSGDEVGKDAAVDAVTGARHWKALQHSGHYGTVVVELGDAMAAGVRPYDDPSVPVGVTYQRHIGCSEG